MLIVALILGIALGACAAWVYGSRRLNAAERELAATRAELDVERRSFDAKVVHAVRAASAEAYQANSSAFLELAESKLAGLRPPAEGVAHEGRRVRCGRSSSRASARRGPCGEQLAQLSERTASPRDRAARRRTSAAAGARSS